MAKVIAVEEEDLMREDWRQNQLPLLVVHDIHLMLPLNTALWSSLRRESEWSVSSFVSVP